MSGHFKIMEALREEGARLTPQRQLVLEVLVDEPGHLTAEDIHARVREHYPYVDLSTIYRTLEFLKEHGIVTQTDLGFGRSVYERRAKAPHHHLVCRCCGETVELGHELLEPLVQALLEKYGFQADLDHLAIFGLCAACRASGSETPSGGCEHVSSN
jgi:Fur family ferric uptake transcriptional regulator